VCTVRLQNSCRLKFFQTASVDNILSKIFPQSERGSLSEIP
jgi:hypothetical protein